MIRKEGQEQLHTQHAKGEISIIPSKIYKTTTKYSPNVLLLQTSILNLLNYPTRYLALQVSLGFKYTSVETEINKKNVTHEEETKFPPGTCTRKNITRKTADISRRYQTYVIIPRFRKQIDAHFIIKRKKNKTSLSYFSSLNRRGHHIVNRSNFVI